MSTDSLPENTALSSLPALSITFENPGANCHAWVYFAWLAFEYAEITPLISLPLIALVFFALGYVLQRGVISPFINRPEHQQFLLLLAIATLLANGCLAVAGPGRQGQGRVVDSQL